MAAKAFTLAREIEDAIDAHNHCSGYEVIYECFHAEAFGCQASETGHCDHGQSCYDI